MRTFTKLFLAVCGLHRPPAVDGRPLPRGLDGWQPLAVRYDRWVAAGIFVQGRRGKTGAKAYKPLLWKWYRDTSGALRATTTLYLDELDPALRLLAECRSAIDPR